MRECNGLPCKSWDTARADKNKFTLHAVSANELQNSVHYNKRNALLKARKQHSLCKVMLCFAASSPFDEKPASYRAIHHFPCPTADVDQITKAATPLAKELFHKDVRYYKIGVGLIGLVDGTHEQKYLFNSEQNNENLMQVFDKLNQRYGNNTVFLGAQGTEQKWAMRRKMLTPQYTIKWQGIPKVKC
ncbi:DUF4113 domain-containing protein [Moritella viscosa]|uniref:DUF4113 domain-containing protein n=1 Tax=Moritella viscosa TaxID=80854 RepID=UPI0009225906|nr:DUF4113 domain-containing protein [Moritella viscosa]SGZ09518.1 Nucleotidyltransferase/DNA polymerase involved in DNA repair [Moritella viscosa]